MKTTSLEKVTHNLEIAINVNIGNPGGLTSQSGPREEPIDYVFLEPWPVFSTVPLLVK